MAGEDESRFAVDPAFARNKKAARGRSRMRLMWRALAGLGGFALLGIAAYVWFAPSDPKPPTAQPTAVQTASNAADMTGDNPDDFSLVQTDAAVDTGINPITTFIDLRRDPMILTLDNDGTQTIDALAGPANFLPQRLGPPAPDRLGLLRDALFVAERQLITTLPSSREDFALFQAQRQGALNDTGPAAVLTPASAPAGTGARVTVASTGSHGNFIAGDKSAKGDGAASFVQTQIRDTTSVALTLRDSQRYALYRDRAVELQTDRSLADVLGANGLPPEDAARIALAAQRILKQPKILPRGTIVAMRLRPDGPAGPQLLQMMLSGPQGYIASLAQLGPGRFVASADPWAGDDTLTLAERKPQPKIAANSVRLLDAVYSSAIRNGLPTELVGEMIVILSQRYDLDRFVTDGDRISVLFAQHPGAQAHGLAQLLFVGISGPSGNMPCYVAATASGAYSCYDFTRTRSAGTAPETGLAHDMVVPVNGVRTSGFGPGFDPVLKQVRNRDGVDWAAPAGTSVRAAAAGTVVFAGDAGEYGQAIHINHHDGLQTRYTHLSAFAKGIAVGASVKAGQEIGKVGSTGRSTSPHLHFELRRNDQPIDPMMSAGSGGDGAVDRLVNRIIHVESGGNASARNPLSSATGAGQFIASTWLRMIRDYKPKLSATMGRQQLLDLRHDYSLSREMVTDLARENEAYLRAHGHQVTPGRLYLAHFLGPAGADRALSADPAALVQSVMGQAVINANPFLRSKTIGDLRQWSNHKMGSAAPGGPSGPAIPVIVPPKIRALREAVDAIIASG